MYVTRSEHHNEDRMSVINHPFFFASFIIVSILALQPNTTKVQSLFLENIPIINRAKKVFQIRASIKY